MSYIYIRLRNGGNGMKRKELRNHYRKTARFLTNEEIELRVSGPEKMLPGMWKRMVYREARKRSIL